MQCVKSIFVSYLIVTLCFKFVFMEIMNTCWRIWISESFIRRSGQLVGTCLVSHIFDRATPFFYRDHDAAVIYLISHVYVKNSHILPTGQWYAPSAVHPVILCYTLLYSAFLCFTPIYTAVLCCTLLFTALLCSTLL